MENEKTAMEKTEVQKAAESGAALGSRSLTKEQIISADDCEKEKVEVPEWGGFVWVYALTARERDEFEETTIEGRGKKTKRNLKNLRARLCARCIRNENGKRLFKGDEILKLGEKSAKALERVFSVAQRLCGMTDEDVEDLVGN